MTIPTEYDGQAVIEAHYSTAKRYRALITRGGMSRSLLRMAGSGGDGSYSHATSTLVSTVRSAATSFGISR